MQKQPLIAINTVTVSKLKSGALKDSFPEYYQLASVVENNPWHKNQNAFDHVVKVYSHLLETLKLHFLNKDEQEWVLRYIANSPSRKSNSKATYSRKDLLLIATLLHDIAKKHTSVTNPDGSAYCPGHELIGASQVSNFSSRFGLHKNDEIHVEKIVRYHGLISEFLNLIIANGKLDFYLQLFVDTVKNTEIELLLLMYADLHGCDLEQLNKQAFNARKKIIISLLKKIIGTHSQTKS